MFLNKNNLPAEKFSRIISLVPSQTELLHYLDQEHEVVGITKFCIHPKENQEWAQRKS
jgi:ABC-type hemin transport system substrate-binding protein